MLIFEVTMYRWFAALACLVCLSLASLGQVKRNNDSAQTGSTSRPGAAELPKLEIFDPSLVDKGKDACADFYQYTCSKWIAAHPITPDLPVSATDVPLFLYNQTILRNTLDAAAADKQATGSERQIGDYWHSCTDEAGPQCEWKNLVAAIFGYRCLPEVHCGFAASAGLSPPELPGGMGDVE